MVLVDVIILTFYTFLEGVLDNFSLDEVPSKEQPSTISGVRKKLGFDLRAHYILICGPFF